MRLTLLIDRGPEATGPRFEESHQFEDLQSVLDAVRDPAVVLLGGAMTFGGRESELGRRFLARIDAEVRRLARPVLAQKTVIDFATLGGDAGYIGAAGVARIEHRKKS